MLHNLTIFTQVIGKMQYLYGIVLSTYIGNFKRSTGGKIFSIESSDELLTTVLCKLSPPIPPCDSCVSISLP